MSILIKGMVMPKTCIECPIQFGGMCYVQPPEIDEPRVAPTVDQCVSRTSWCPLIEIPEHHGDLIDRNNANLKFVELAKTLEEKHGYESGVPYAVAALLLKSKEEFPIIIPTE